MIASILLHQILVAVGVGLLWALVFAAIGLVSGTDETTTLAPLTLLVRAMATVFHGFLLGLSTLALDGEPNMDELCQVLAALAP